MTHDVYPSLDLYRKMGCPYVVCRNWDGPLWTGHCMMLDDSDSYGDQLFLHELFHWMLATKEQRMIADFGLGQNVDSSMKVFGSNFQEVTELQRHSTTRLWDGSKAKDSYLYYWQEIVASDALLFYTPLTEGVGIDGCTSVDVDMWATEAWNDFGGKVDLDDLPYLREMSRMLRKFHPSFTMRNLRNLYSEMRNMWQ